MTTRIESTPIGATHISPMAENPATAVPAEAAVALISSDMRAQGTRSRGPTPSSADPVAARNAEVIDRALRGSPELLVGLLMAEMRETQTLTQRAGVQANSQAAESAHLRREQAMAEAQRAAEEAGTFLGISGDWALVGKIAAVVAGAAATVATAGTASVAIVAVAGILLTTCSEKIGEALVDAGMSPEAAEWVVSGLKVAGAFMAAGPAGLTAAGIAAGTTAASELTDEAAQLAVAMGASDDVALALAVSIAVIAAVVSGVFGGAAEGRGAMTDLQRGISRFGTGSRLFSGAASATATGYEMASHEREHAEAQLRADGEAAEVAWEGASAEMQEFIEAMKRTLRAFARAMTTTRAMVEARGDAMQAAIGQRA